MSASRAICALVMIGWIGIATLTPANAQSTRGTITGTLGDAEVSWRISTDSSGFRHLGESAAMPSMGGEPWAAPEGVGAISLSIDLSEGQEQQLVSLEIFSPDGEIIWRADEASNASLDASYAHWTNTLSNVKGDLSTVLYAVDASGNRIEGADEMELVLRFEGVLERYGH